MNRSQRLRVWLWGGAAALAAYAVSIGVILSSRHSGNQAVNAILVPLIGLSFAVSGLVAWTRRPANGTGKLLLLVSLAWSANAIADANDPWVYTIASSLSAVVLATFVQLLLSFPSGRLRSKLERRVVFAGYVLGFAGNLVVLPFDAHPTCATSGACPGNTFLVVRSDRTAHLLQGIIDIVAAVLIGFVVVLLVRHYRAATPAARRVLRTIYLVGAATLVLLSASLAIEPFAHGLSSALGTFGLLVFATLPYFFLAGVLHSRLARAGVAELLVAVRDSTSLAEAEASLRRALREPSLVLAHWRPEREEYVDVDGAPYELPGPDDGLAVTPIESEHGEKLAALVHDPALLDEPELLEGVAAAGRLALHRDRLQTQLQARLLELERERDFVRDVVNAAPAFFIVLDREGSIVRFNDALVRATGVVDDENVRGRPFVEVFVAGADRDEVSRLLGEAAPGRNEHRWVDGRGDELVVEWSILPIADASGQPRLLVTGLDVSARVRQEEELRRSRARIVEAGDAERRRLERNLHDGAQQRLVSLSLTLRLAETRLRDDPAAAQELLSGAGAELSQALAELRELARGIHPAVLTDRGLGPALDALAERSTVPVELDVVLDERLPEAVEAAIFYVVSESLANVAKYAEAGSALVRVSREDGRVTVTVADDGVGGADPAQGTGLRGLEDRVAALDGTVAVSSAPGSGTSVSAELPLLPARAAAARRS